MKVKKYDDDTFNIHYEIGDIVKIKHNPKFGENDKDEDRWGKVVRIVGKPLTAKLIIEPIETDKIEAFVWNVKPVDEEGKILPKEEIMKKAKVVEMIQVNLQINESKKIIKFTDI